jgi:hypothetical protein
MRMTKGWTGLRIAVIALGLFTSASTSTKADSILGYGTAGAIDATSSSDGVTGANVISFVPITSASVDANSNISLGYFQVTGQAAGQSTTYNNTPFSITYSPSSIDGNAVTGTVTITGVLNGTVTGTNYSQVVATFNPLANGMTQVVDGSNLVSSTLSIPQGSQLLVASTTLSGETTVAGSIATTSTPNGSEHSLPEPSTIALFLSTVGGLGLRKYVLARRQSSQA